MDRIRIADLQADKREVTLPNGVTLTYRPTLVTGPAMKDIERLMRGENFLAQAKMLCKIVTAWDLVGPIESIRFDDATDEVIEAVHVAAGEAVPLDPGIVQHVNPLILASVILQIAEDVIPNGVTATPSGSR